MMKLEESMEITGEFCQQIALRNATFCEMNSRGHKLQILTVLLLQTMDAGGDQLCVRRVFLGTAFSFKNLTAQLINSWVFVYQSTKQNCFAGLRLKPSPVDLRVRKVHPALLDHKVIPHIMHLFTVKP